jgi:hypothetical protein
MDERIIRTIIWLASVVIALGGLALLLDVLLDLLWALRKPRHKNWDVAE